MAIFQRVYRGYHGTLTPALKRPLVIFRYALADIFSSRLFAAFFALCFVHPLFILITIYMRYNIELLIQIEADLSDLVPIDAAFFAHWVQIPQLFIAFALILFIGPALVSPDMRNNAMPLFLSRPVSKSAYITGKLLVLIFLCSLVTWVPGLLLIGFQSYLATEPWLSVNLNVPLAALTSSLVWIVPLSLLALTVSALVKWKIIARLFFFGVVFMGSALGAIIREIFGGWSGSTVSLVDVGTTLVNSLYGVQGFVMLPGWAAGVSLATVGSLSILLLMRRIRAFEVVA